MFWWRLGGRLLIESTLSDDSFYKICLLAADSGEIFRYLIIIS